MGGIMAAYGWTVLLMIALICLLVSEEVSPINITIGAIFEDEIVTAQRAFGLAVDYINDKVLGPGSRLKYILNTTQFINSFDSMQLVCYQASLGVAGFVGPFSSTAVGAIAPLTDNLHLPIMAPIATNPVLDDAVAYPFLFKMSPSDTKQSLAIADLIEYFGWKNFAILTSNTEYGSHGLSQLAVEAGRRNLHVVLSQQFQVNSDISRIDAGKQLSNIKDLNVRVIVLNCEVTYARHVMKQATQKGMTSSEWAWVVTDGVTSSNETPQRHMVGTVGTRHTFGRGPFWDEFETWANNEPDKKYSECIDNIDAFQSRTIDAVLTLAQGLHDLQDESPVTPSSLDCLGDKSWGQGEALREKISKLHDRSFPGKLLFTSNLSPMTIVYDYVNLTNDGWVKIGEWSLDSGPQFSSLNSTQLPGKTNTKSDGLISLKGRTLRVVTIEEPPFVIVKNKKPSHLSHLPREEVLGLSMDLLDELADRIGFKYQLYLVNDGKYGAQEARTGTWNGMVADLVNREADMAAAPLTINYIRETDIDFSRPYFDLGIGIIMRKPPPEKWDPFKFTRPFSAELWYYIMGTTLVVAVYVTVLNRLSPYDVHGHFIYKDEPHQIKGINDYREYKIFKRAKIQSTNELNLGNGLWLSLASLLHQGAEQYPRAFSSRISLLVWWMGVMILIATYTANLAAHLTSNRAYEEINSAEDLAKQSKIIYGTVADSAPFQFFNSSQVELYKSMANFMLERRTLVATSNDGLNLIRKGGYAFLWDSAVLDFVKQQKPCGILRPVGRPFGKSGYGFGLQKNSPYNRELSQHILELREKGFIEKLNNKWYVEKTECPPEEVSSNDPSGKISVTHAAGVFLIVWCGCGAGFIVLFIEWIVACSSSVDRRDPSKPQTWRESFWIRWRKMIAELKESYFQCGRRDNRESYDLSEENKSANENTSPKGPVWRRSPVERIFRSNFRESTPKILSIPPVHLPSKDLVRRDLNSLGHLTGRSLPHCERP